MAETLTTREAAKTDSSQARDMRMEATLRIQRLAELTGYLKRIEEDLVKEARLETDEALSEALIMASLELHTVANRANSELLRVSMLASLALEGK